MRSKRKQYIDKKLIMRLRLFIVIFIIMSGIGIYNIVKGFLLVKLALAALVGGIGIGLVMGRGFNVIWHEEAGKAITKMDVFGIVILVGNLLFAIFRRKIFGYWLAGNQLSAFTIWFSAGIMLGRLFTLRTKIGKVLRDQGL